MLTLVRVPMAMLDNQVLRGLLREACALGLSAGLSRPTQLWPFKTNEKLEAGLTQQLGLFAALHVRKRQV